MRFLEIKISFVVFILYDQNILKHDGIQINNN